MPLENIGAIIPRRGITLCWALTISQVVQAVIFEPQDDPATVAAGKVFSPVDLTLYQNNCVFAIHPNHANFDGSGSECSVC